MCLPMCAGERVHHLAKHEHCAAVEQSVQCDQKHVGHAVGRVAASERRLP